jgi:hypothetical protein
LTWTVLVYLASRALLLAVLLATSTIQHQSLLSELGRWDGTWYAHIASNGYPRHVSHGQTALGFFPLYPLVIWLLVHSPWPLKSVITTGVLVSLVGGLVATILVQRLASGWWGESAGRRAAALFCFFPGSVVFSMAYTEGLLLPLAAACIIALQRRRWVLAGILAGFATALQPEAIALTVACAVAAALELRRHRGERGAARSLLAPLLSLTGICAFAVFLWVWTGTPFATLDVQRNGWHQGVGLGPVNEVRFLATELSQFNFGHLSFNLIPVAGLLGGVLLVIGVTLLFLGPRRISAEAMAYTLSVGVLAVVSANLTTNARILIIAFPAVLVFAYRLRGRGYVCLMGATTVLLVITSALTYGGHSLTP